ncbi:Thiamine phosphate synthase [Alteripontixanthobacter maritimus]|uniref:Thiamine phosphate synthase n=1 Tax=Alteripontixanthobacter maritimus TaxID=2161824 RepID=A0A369Q3D0_9SPHN|nr:thiamine phosphate synthase [Alteripontixanthobacter maritimus]RDC59022.1 Thiamine phosphate synthase [Alteripontixanthobacter maritimus]
MPRQFLPRIWLMTDARNDAVLERAITRLPRGSGVVFRHYHLAEEARRQRFSEISAIARAHGHAVVLSGPASLAVRWKADGTYGTPDMLGGSDGLLTLATAHNRSELRAAARAGADAAFLSPVFSTRSHPNGTSLGPARFRLLARHAGLPVIALGGMTRMRARLLGHPHWAAIDGLS